MSDGAVGRRNNDRVRVWEYGENVCPAEDRVHCHGHDAVVVWFDGDNRPNVHFLSHGKVPGSDGPTAAVRTFVFEIL